MPEATVTAFECKFLFHSYHAETFIIQAVDHLENDKSEIHHSTFQTDHLKVHTIEDFLSHLDCVLLLTNIVL